MADRRLEGFRVAALVQDRFEQVELTQPKEALEQVGARVEIVSAIKDLTGMHHFEPGDHFRCDVDVSEARAEDYDALLLPGGVINADTLRCVPEAQHFARQLVRRGKPVAVVCHGGWLLISAGLVQGRTVTSWPSLQDDFRNAGAHWVDQEVVVDGNWVSSRKPEDLPAFNRELIRIFAQAHQPRQVA